MTRKPAAAPKTAPELRDVVYSFLPAHGGGAGANHLLRLDFPGGDGTTFPEGINNVQ